MSILPTMVPTGAMSSGVYTDYMISYLNDAMDDVYDYLAKYWGVNTIDGWSSKWTTIISDTSSEVTTLTSDISKIKQQIQLIKDKLRKL